jgi:CHASE3 domain sensor protein
MTVSELRSQLKTCERLRLLLEDVLDDIDVRYSELSQFSSDPSAQQVADWLNNLRNRVLSEMDDVVEKGANTYVALSQLRPH